MFARYLQRENVRLVKEDVERLGLRSKQHVTEHGRAYGGASFSRGAIYKILSNPIYLGEIVHKGERHPGSHQAIIDQVTWDQVQALLASNAARQRNQAAAQSPSLLAGLIFDQDGEPLTPTHANKKGRRYRYYVSRSALDGSGSAAGEGAKRAGASWRLPAAEIEELLVSAACDMLCDGAELIRQLQIGQLDTPQLNRTLANATERGDELRGAPNLEKRTVLRRILRRVEVGEEAVTIQLHASELMHVIDGKEIHAA